MTIDLETLRYPTGKHEFSGPLSPQALEERIQNIASLPGRLKKEVLTLSGGQLDTPYRPGGWTVRQVVNHISDSHMNGFIRCKLALTEQNPMIKPYDEASWATLEDSRQMPVEPAIDIITALHKRWVVLLRSLPEADLQKTYTHPEYKKTFTLGEAISLYSWHGNHHLAHIIQLKKRNNWP